MKDDRFQNQSFLVRLWRHRHYIRIPLVAFRIWRNRPKEDPTPFRICWSIAKGLVHSRMKWYYTWDEVKKDLIEKHD